MLNGGHKDLTACYLKQEGRDRGEVLDVNQGQDGRSVTTGGAHVT